MSILSLLTENLRLTKLLVERIVPDQSEVEHLRAEAERYKQMAAHNGTVAREQMQRLQVLQETMEQRIASIERESRATVEGRVAEHMAREEKRIRDSAVKASRSTIRGQATEKLVPLTSDFPFQATDCQFLGSPVDYVVFEGAGKILDGEECDITVTLVDVKCGKYARLSKLQKKIQEALAAGRTRFVTLQVPE